MSLLLDSVYVHHWAGPTVFAEASVIPGTVFDLGLWINVQEWTFLVAALTCEGQTEMKNRHKTLTSIHLAQRKKYTRGADQQSRSSSEWFYETSSLRTKLGVEVAFRHLGHVVLVEKLALVSLFTQSSEPVLTHHRLLSADVTERTHPTWEGEKKPDSWT